MCPCGWSNYPDRRMCRKCSSLKVEGARAPESNPPSQRPEWKCTQCHTTNYMNRMQCRNCRTDHKKSPSSPPPATSREMWRCPQCFQNNLGRKDYCVGCKLQRQSEEDMDRRMAASCSSSSSSSSRPTPSAPRDNFEAVLSDAKNLIKKGKDEKGRGDGRRHSRDFNNESTVRRPSRERELKKKVNFSKGDRILADKKSLTSKSGKQQVSAHGDNSQKCPSSRVSRETPGVERSSSLVIFDAVDPEWAAVMNKRYGLDGEESPFNVVDETKEETSPPRQPKRADETPPAEASRPRAPSPAPPPPGPPLPKLQSPVKPKSDPYECEDEDPATAALRREIREYVNLIVSL